MWWRGRNSLRKLVSASLEFSYSVWGQLPETRRGLEQRPKLIVSNKTRWVAIATGCFITIAGLPAFGAASAAVTIFLIVGAIMQPRFPRLGRGLICAGAVWLSFWVFDIGVLTVLESNPHGLGVVRFIILASVILVALCDLVIVLEEVKIRRVGVANR